MEFSSLICIILREKLGKLQTDALSLCRLTIIEKAFFASTKALRLLSVPAPHNLLVSRWSILCCGRKFTFLFSLRQLPTTILLIKKPASQALSRLDERRKNRWDFVELWWELENTIIRRNYPLLLSLFCAIKSTLISFIHPLLRLLGVLNPPLFIDSMRNDSPRLAHHMFTLEAARNLVLFLPKMLFRTKFMW